MERRLLQLFKSTVPKLTSAAHKGQCGRICVVGGSLEFTGAPYFAAISALKVGADLSFVLSSPEAAPIIKTYSPELMVHPYLGTPDGGKIFVETVLPKLHSLVIGPGLGRKPELASDLKLIVEKARERNLPIVLDADALHFLCEDLNFIHGYSKAILTPNAMEFRRLYSVLSESHQIKGNMPCLDESSEKSLESVTLEMARLLEGPTILRKGSIDVASDGKSVVTLRDEKGSPRRCGGQGDVLSGSLGTFAFWSSSRPEKTSEYSWQLVACKGASAFTRRCSQLAYQENGLSTTTSDLICNAGDAFSQMLFSCNKQDSVMFLSSDSPNLS